MITRAAGFVSLVGLLLLLAAAPAAADPAGPTDYRSEIVAIEPDTDAIEVTIIGGDSFLELELLRAVTVEVPGYNAEPYLVFEADGTVLENQRSPSRWLNDDRYGEADVPAEATADAQPDWKVVAEDGRYAWHDHRIHWMNTDHPPGAEPGDVILGFTVPITVDGEPVVLSVESVLLAPPSNVPAILGGIIAALAAAGAIGWLGLRRGVSAVLVPTGVLALIMGIWATTSVPAVAAPGFTIWLLPAVATIAAVGAALIDDRRPPTAELLSALAGVQLVLWGWGRLDALTKALIPTDAPQGLDRAVIVAALVVGVVAVVAAGVAVLRPAPLDDPVPA